MSISISDQAINELSLHSPLLNSSSTSPHTWNTRACIWIDKKKQATDTKLDLLTQKLEITYLQNMQYRLDQAGSQFENFFIQKPRKILRKLLENFQSSINSEAEARRFIIHNLERSPVFIGAKVGMT